MCVSDHADTPIRKDLGGEPLRLRRRQIEQPQPQPGSTRYRARRAQRRDTDTDSEQQRHQRRARTPLRDFGMSRNPGLADALSRLSQTLQQARERPESDLGNNCGLILTRRMLRDDPVSVSTDWVLQTVTWGFAPTFQESIGKIVHDHAQACSSAPDVAAVPESVLECTMRRVGL